ncbi:MAG: glycerol-3-phosphate dehydrogenase/oxidase [Acidiferrobacterales bacterium]
MTSDSRDVVVIGGGIHGVGVAQAVAAAGYRILLIEQTALASGTSGRSSKLIHGGLRYLETAQLRLVRESLRERAILLALAPDLVRRVPFHIPVYRDTVRRPWKVGVGLSLYALLGSLAPDTRFSTVPRGAWTGLDGLRTNGLRTVWRYYDAQTDDAALTRAVMRSAVHLGAELACPAEFLSATRVNGGYLVIYREAGAEKERFCHALVNAAGPWIDPVAKRVAPAPPRLAVDLVQGTHIVLPGRLTQGVYYVEAPWDRRAIFVMPWYDRTLVGTTESHYTGDPAFVQPLPDELTYLEKTVRHYFPERDSDIVDGFAGLRVLPQGNTRPFRRTRETILLTEPSGPVHYVAIYGGKLTGYRATGARVMRLVQGVLGAAAPVADTARIPLSAD